MSNPNPQSNLNTTPGPVRFHRMITSARDAASQVWDQADRDLTAQAAKGRVNTDNLTCWYRLVIELAWWNRLLAALEDTPDARTDLTVAVEVAERVRGAATDAQYTPPLTASWGEALPFEIAGHLVCLDAHMRFLIETRRIIAANTPEQGTAS